MKTMRSKSPTSRRKFLGLAGSAAVAGAMPVVTLRPLEATPAMLTAAIRNVVGEAPVRTGKVKLDIPPLVENGNTVPMTVSVGKPDDRERVCEEHPRLQREEPAAQYRQLPSAPGPAARRFRPASGSRTARRWSRSPGSPTTASGPPARDIIVTLAACTEEVN